MTEVLKDKLNSLIDKWTNQIDENPDKQKVIDIATAVEDLLCRSIVHICFGEDVSDMQVEIEFPKENTRKKLTLAEALNEYNTSVTELSANKWLHPVYKTIRNVTGIKHLTNY